LAFHLAIAKRLFPAGSLLIWLEFHFAGSSSVYFQKLFQKPRRSILTQTIIVSPAVADHLFHQTLADKVITDYSFQKTEFIGASQVFQTTKKLDYERDWQSPKNPLSAVGVLFVKVVKQND
jgi:hypothetical protein